MFFLWTLKQNLINSDFCIPYFVKNVNEIMKQNLQNLLFSLAIV